MSGASHRDLRVWQTAISLAGDCYTLAKKLPRDEMMGMTFQIRRAAGSVPANIAEGYGRRTKRELIRYVNIANGSLVELDTHFELALRVGYLSLEDVEPLRVQIKDLGGMMYAFKAAIRRRPEPPAESA